MTRTDKPGAFMRARWIAVGGVIAAVGVAVATGVVLRSGDNDVEVTVPAGATMVAALERTVSTEQTVGTSVELRTTEPLTLENDLTLPEGSILRGEVTHAKGGGRIAGGPELTLRFTRLEVEGTEYRVTAEPFRVTGKGDAQKSALQIGGGTVAGAVVGAVAGDAVKGAVVGAVIGTGVALATPGNHIVLPAGQKLRVRLSEPVTIQLAAN